MKCENKFSKKVKSSVVIWKMYEHIQKSGIKFVRLIVTAYVEATLIK